MSDSADSHGGEIGFAGIFWKTKKNTDNHKNFKKCNMGKYKNVLISNLYTKDFVKINNITVFDYQEKNVPEKFAYSQCMIDLLLPSFMIYLY